MRKQGIWALAGAAAGVGAGLVAQRSFVRRKRRTDPEAGAAFGQRRAERKRYIELRDGGRLFVEESGPSSDRGAVFIHGSALRTDVWYYQLPGVGDHRLVFYDLRGHGLSRPKGEADYTTATLTDDLLRVIEDARLKEVVLVGHSVGGMIALDLCARRSDLLGDVVKGAVLVNTTHRPAYETLMGGAAVARVERLARRPFDLLGTQHDKIDRLRRIIKPSDSLFLAVAFAAFGPGASAKQIDFTYDMLAETPTDVIFDLFRCYRDFEATEVLADVTVPALVITGSNDRLTVMGASEYLAEHLPKAELEVFEGCGHMTMLERHRDFNTMLERFLGDVLGPPDGRDR